MYNKYRKFMIKRTEMKTELETAFLKAALTGNENDYLEQLDNLVLMLFFKWQDFNEKFNESVTGFFNCYQIREDNTNEEEFKWLQMFIEEAIMKDLKKECDLYEITSPYALAVRALRYKDYIDIFEERYVDDIERRLKRDLQVKGLPNRVMELLKAVSDTMTTVEIHLIRRIK